MLNHIRNEWLNHIQGFPTVKFFGEDKSKAIEYDSARNAKVKTTLETSGKDVKLHWKRVEKT